jgi:N-acetyl sugar amidotransferase
MKEIFWCKNCLNTSTRPRITFDERGWCNACQWMEEKKKLNWSRREKELTNILTSHRSNDGGFDCIVPVSGGKDSAFVAHQLKHRFGMNPLCVTWAPFDWTTIGFSNLKNFVDSGFFNIIGQPNGNLHRKLAKISFRAIGDPWQPFTYGQKTWAFHMAKKFGIKLMFYGENGEIEYGGSLKYKNKPNESIEDWDDHHFRGADISLMTDIGLENGILTKQEACDPDLFAYNSLSMDEIKGSGLEMHWMSYYQKWVPQENFYYAATHTGFRCNDSGRSESTYTKYTSLDDKMDGFHWLLGYAKFGLGRASRDAQTDIRRHHITREEGVRLVHLYDHEFPSKYFQWMLEYLGISEEYFFEVVDFYKNGSNVWEYKNGKQVLTKIVT